MAPKDSEHRDDPRRHGARFHTVKNQNPSSQTSKASASDDARSTPRNTHATTSNAQTNPQPLNPQTLHQHTTTEAQLSQDPYSAHIIRENETRRLQDSFYTLGVDIPSNFYQNKISGIYQSQIYTPISTQTSLPNQAYSTQYLAPETAISHTKQPIDDDYTWIETRDEYESNEQEVVGSDNDLNGMGDQFPASSYQTPRYSQSIYQMEADMTQEL